MNRRIEIIFPPVPPVSMDEDNARHLRNLTEGSDIEALKEVLLTKMPAVEQKNVTTVYEILFTQRTEDTPSSHPKLYVLAIVRVWCQGHYVPDKWQSIQGLYQIRLNGYHDATEVKIQKLLPQAWLQYNIPPLPLVKDLYRHTVSA